MQLKLYGPYKNLRKKDLIINLMIINNPSGFENFDYCVCISRKRYIQ